MFCALRVVLGDTEGVRSSFTVLRTRASFGRYRGLSVQCSYFALLYSFSAVPMASGPIFIFRAPDLDFSGTEGVGFSFHVFCSRDRFGRYRWCRVSFLCFPHPDSFSMLVRASGSVFIFSLPDTFWAVPRASDLVFLFCALGLIFGGTEGVGPHFHVCVPGLILGGTRAPCPVFMFYAPEFFFAGIEGVGSSSHVLRFRTRLRRYRRRLVQFSCFALSDLFWAVPSPVFMFCALRLIFGGTDGVRSHFHVCALELVFDCTEDVGSHFYVLRFLTRFVLY
jgi:hypothetical protein